MNITVPLIAPPPLMRRAPIQIDSPKIPRAESPCWNRLFLIRHGESTCNEVNRFAGSANAPLTSLGRAQARRAAQSLEGLSPDCIFVSPLSRAIETAEMLFPRGSAGVPHRIDPRITERDFGDFTLRNKAELQRVHGIRGFDEALYDASKTMAGAESLEAFHDRVADFLFRTVVPRLQSGERVLVVAHKYVVELMARMILKLPEGNGFDLRLPNSEILRGGDLARYCRRENRSLNRLRDWTVLRHDWLLSAAAVAGLGFAAAGLPVSLPWPVGVVLLMLATLISLTRVDLEKLTAEQSPRWVDVVLRFAVIPIGLAGIGLKTEWAVPLMCGAVALAAPAALTSVTLSRCAGGLVLPAVGTIFRSSAVGCLSMILLLHMAGITRAWTMVPLLLGTVLITTLAPAMLAMWLRRRAPIATARFGERQAVLSVLLLGAFVLGSTAQLNLAMFFPYGWIAIAAGLVARSVAWLRARRGSLKGADDYLSMAYPNLFLVIILGRMLDVPELTQTAAWFLLPMFLLSPIDVGICRSLIPDDGGEHLRAHLGIEPAIRPPANNENPVSTCDCQPLMKPFPHG